MPAMGQDDLIFLAVAGLWVAGGAMLYMRAQRKAKERSQLDGLRGTLAKRRDERDDKRPTIVDQRLMEVSGLRALSVRDEDLALQENEIWARLQMEDDLGHYAEGPRPINLDQSQRDLLIAHARRDAAEALANVKLILSEVREQRRERNELMRWLSFAMFLALGAAYLWRYGFIGSH